MPLSTLIPGITPRDLRISTNDFPLYFDPSSWESCFMSVSSKVMTPATLDRKVRSINCRFQVLRLYH